LPSIKPQLLFGAVMAIVNSFAIFDVAMQLTGFPSPQYAARTIVGHLYDYGFVRFEMGYASAIAVVLFGFTFGLSRIMMRIFSTRGE
jgi:multiple sugar transport system permease protein